VLLGYAVAQLADAPSYKPERGGFNSRWRTSSRSMALGSTQPLTEMNNRNISSGVIESRCIGLTILPLSCADCPEIWEPKPPGTLWACNRPVLWLLFFRHCQYNSHCQECRKTSFRAEGPIPFTINKGRTQNLKVNIVVC